MSGKKPSPWENGRLMIGVNPHQDPKVGMCISSFECHQVGRIPIHFYRNFWVFFSIFRSLLPFFFDIFASSLHASSIRTCSNMSILYIATDKYLEHHLEKKYENRHSGDVLSMKSLEHTQNLYLEHFQAILRTSQWGTNGNHTFMYVRSICIIIHNSF